MYTAIRKKMFAGTSIASALCRIECKTLHGHKLIINRKHSK